MFITRLSGTTNQEKEALASTEPGDNHPPTPRVSASQPPSTNTTRQTQKLDACSVLRAQGARQALSDPHETLQSNRCLTKATVPLNIYAPAQGANVHQWNDVGLGGTA